MLAYVFWHRADPAVEVARYEAELVAFHQALGADPPDGFAGSVSHRFDSLPWLGPGPVYEDWYLASDWTAVGALERGAVSGTRRDPHDRSAAGSAHGAGAVYGTAAGDQESLRDGRRRWFTKPAEISYGDLDASLADLVGAPGTGLWRRRLVLGPAPENCMAGAAGESLPDGLEALAVAGAPVFSQ